MAYVFPTPGDIPKKIFSFPRVDFASSRFNCASSASGSGRSASVMPGKCNALARSTHARTGDQSRRSQCHRKKANVAWRSIRQWNHFDGGRRPPALFVSLRLSRFAVTAPLVSNACCRQRLFLFSKIADLYECRPQLERSPDLANNVVHDA